MTSLQTRLNSARTLDRQGYLQLLKLAFSQGEFHFASQLALDWITEFPGDLPMRYWYGKARAEEGHLSLGAAILDEVLQADPTYREALQARVEIEQRLPQQLAKKKNYPTNQKSVHPNITDYYEWLIALGEETPVIPKRPYGSLTARWGEELRALQQELSLIRKNPVREPLLRIEHSLHELIAIKPSIPLIPVVLLKTQYIQLQQNEIPSQAFRSVVEHYQHRFPQCLYFSYFQVDLLMEYGEPEKAVALLHSLIARDLSAQVATQIWNSDHEYLSIWPKNLSKSLEVQIPASIASILGLNRLPMEVTLKPSPETTIPITEDNQSLSPNQHPTIDSEIQYTEKKPKDSNISTHSIDVTPIQATLNKLSEQIRKPELANFDGRYPLYVILTSRDNLIQSFGQTAADQIEKAALKFLKALLAQKGWNGFLYYVDQGIVLPNHPKLSPLVPAKQNDPWAIKHSLHELDNHLAKLGEMIGALLIVGGDDIIPFHRLPNPIEDGDNDVPSDNPYGSRDENYYVMDWPVGRLPCPSGTPELLLELFGKYTTHYEKPAKKSFALSPINFPISLLFNWVRFLTTLFNHKNLPITSFGYTAASWRFASFSVFNEIGKPQSMLISPQWKQTSKSAQSAKRRLVRHSISTALRFTDQLSSEGLSTKSLALTENVKIPEVTAGYFNLHGIADSAEWFGQSDPTESGYDAMDQSDHPVALQPGDILLSQEANIQVILSEACFGAHIIHKAVEESIALSFLKKGCSAFVGSTCTAYGSNDTPLIAADYLASAFWRYIRQGYPAGEALRLAKLNLAETFSRINESLDAEDQKTIISFVLYGDPLAQPNTVQKTPKVLRHTRNPFVIKNHTCDHAMQSLPEDKLSPQMEAYVKKLVEKYLPGMEQAQFEVLSEKEDCQENCPNCKVRSILPSKHFDPKSNRKSTNQQNKPRRVIILSKQFQWQSHTYTQYGRLTIDSNGKLLKVAISK